MDEKNIINENIQEKVKEKVEPKSVNKSTQSQYKECEVLVYDANNKTLIISFDGLGYEFENVAENPGKIVRVKATGKVGNSNFKLTLV